MMDPDSRCHGDNRAVIGRDGLYHTPYTTLPRQNQSEGHSRQDPLSLSTLHTTCLRSPQIGIT